MAIFLLYCRKFAYLCVIFRGKIEDKLYIEKLKEYFSIYQQFTSDEILKFYSNFNPFISKSIVNWRIYQLIKKGIILRKARGKFSLGKFSKFEPEITNIQKKTFNTIKNKFPYIDFCVWHTNFLKEFTHHQINLDFTVLEIERSALDSIYLQLKDVFRQVYLKPTSSELNNLQMSSKPFLIILPLVSEAPIQNIDKIKTITIEKLLVDIFSDEIWESLKGYELLKIFENAFEKYSINSSKLLRYAFRKGKKDEMMNFLSTNKLVIK